MMGDVLPDRLFQLRYAGEHAAAYPVRCEFTEPALDHVQPRTAAPLLPQQERIDFLNSDLGQILLPQSRT